MLSSSLERGLNIARPGNVPREPQENSERLFSNGRRALVDDRLIHQRDGKALLKPIQTVINGVPFGRPYQAPFAVR
jgi:hypothetical protein